MNSASASTERMISSSETRHADRHLSEQNLSHNSCHGNFVHVCRGTVHVLYVYTFAGTLGFVHFRPTRRHLAVCSRALDERPQITWHRAGTWAVGREGSGGEEVCRQNVSGFKLGASVQDCHNYVCI